MNYNKKFNKKLSKRRFSKKLKKKSTRKIKRGGSFNNNHFTEYDNFFTNFKNEANKFSSNSCNPKFEINKINTDIDNFFENQKQKFKRVL